MAYLGRPYRCVYSGKELRSGMTSVVGVVTRPDGVVTGPYLMMEYTHPVFKGLYFFDLLTTPLDPIGEWTVMFVSPEEDGNRQPYKIEFDPIPGEITTYINNSLPTDLVGEIADMTNISGTIADYDVLAATVADF